MKRRNKLKTIPLFKSEKEEAGFWEKADSTLCFTGKGKIHPKRTARTIEAKIIPVTSLRTKLLQYLNRASQLGQEYIVTKNGKPYAVIMGYEEWESWKETLEIMSDPKLMRRIKKSRAYFARGGKGKTIDEVFK